MKFATKDIEWVHPNPEIGKQSFTVKVREPEDHADRLTLCGTEERINDIITQLLFRYPNSSKKKFVEAKDAASALLVIQQVIEAGLEVDLTATRGEGLTSKAKERDVLRGILDDPNATREQKLAALNELGYNI